MISVLHIASGDLWAGAEKQLYTLLLALATTGRVRVLAAILNPGTLAGKLQQADIDTLVLDESRQNTLDISRELNHLIKRHHPDIIHTHRLKENIIGSLVGAWRDICSATTTRTSCLLLVQEYFSL